MQAFVQNVLIMLQHVQKVILQMKRQNVVFNVRKINMAKIVDIDVTAQEMNVEKNIIDENEYDEIDESLICDIKSTTDEENKMDTDEEDHDHQSIKADTIEGYLNPYQPIISTAVDVHQYTFSTTKNDKKENPTTSDENQGNSDYLHLYHSLTKNTSDTKLEYYRLKKNVDTDIPKI
ncbi:unnamed protein product [Mytilus edulis]|uniref:Uncharacterized protein n=1 Tax=Mytilus edulis TaxID=6550 RepID=A0A8S3TPL5_MYTED|nr:unnamed protein product [Mytilus edulis]